MRDIISKSKFKRNWEHCPSSPGLCTHMHTCTQAPTPTPVHKYHTYLSSNFYMHRVTRNRKERGKDRDRDRDKCLPNLKKRILNKRPNFMLKELEKEQTKIKFSKKEWNNNHLNRNTWNKRQRRKKLNKTVICKNSQTLYQNMEKRKKKIQIKSETRVAIL